MLGLVAITMAIFLAAMGDQDDWSIVDQYPSGVGILCFEVASLVHDVHGTFATLQLTQEFSCMTWRPRSFSASRLFSVVLEHRGPMPSFWKMRFLVP